MEIESTEQQHIMVVEDDTSLARWITDYLESHGFLVTLATQGDIALELLRSDEPDAVGTRARAFYSNPIIMLTARDTDSDEVLGLETGADDYLAKPVKPTVLLARLRALLRRNFNRADQTVIHVGGLTVDSQSRTVTLNDDVVSVSAHEFDVLHLLVTHVGEVLSRDALVEKIRGIEYDGFDRSVDICISRLRRKLKDDGQEPRRIKTLRGVGYLLAVDAW